MAVSDQPVTARGNWLQRNSYTSHWLHLNIWNQGDLLALKEFQDLCLNLIATIATDNTMVVACLRRGGLSRALFVALCPTMENPDLVLQEKGSSPTHSRFNHVPSGDTLHQDAISSSKGNCEYIKET